MINNRTIINADDFGLSESVNRAVCTAFNNHLISNTTILANGKFFEDAVALAKENGFAEKVGIHFNLTEGEPLTEDIKGCPSFCKNGVFHHKNNRLKPLSSFENNALYKELSAQAAKLKNAGLTVDHADSHHHIHTAVFIAPIVFRVCKENDIKRIRLHRNLGNIPFYKRVVKDLYNKTLHSKGFITTDYFGSLKDIDGIDLPDRLEIMVHTDYDKNGILIDRRDFADGKPEGVPLCAVAGNDGSKLISYGDL